jgi:Phytanoyl-CoA dioxygenase (PhyH)
MSIKVDVKKFSRDGYLLIKNVFSRDEIQQLREAAYDYWREHWKFSFFREDVWQQLETKNLEVIRPIPEYGSLEQPE